MITTRRVILIEDLVKRFGSFTALDGLNLAVSEGEVHGFLGPNGAGKSTTIRVLLGLLRKNAGEVTLLGGDPWRDVVELHRRLAYVPGDVALWPSLTGGEAIDLLGNLRGGLDEVRRAELIERFELDPTKRGRQYSKGNRQKVAIIAALSADVELRAANLPRLSLTPWVSVAPRSSSSCRPIRLRLANRRWPTLAAAVGIENHAQRHQGLAARTVVHIHATPFGFHDPRSA